MIFLKKIYFKFFKNKTDYKSFKNKQLFDKIFKDKIASINKALLEKKKINFLHSGHCGDLIYSLATIKKISEGHECSLFINTNKKIDIPYHNHPGDGLYINNRIYEFLLPLLQKQKFIKKVEKFTNQEIDVNLDLFRDLPINLMFNSPRWYFHLTGVQTNLSEKSLEVEDHPKISNKIIILRSFRWRNNFVNYNFLDENKDLIFVGMKNEYEDLKKQIKNLEFYDCSDFYEMAQIIKSSKFFIGNMSPGYAIAESLKIPRLLEACPEMPYVHPVGKNAYDFYFQEHFENYVKLLSGG